nr:PREDICTED: cytochrome P450 4V2-like [Bemisia tabaci]
MDGNIPKLGLSNILLMCVIGAITIRAIYQRWKNRKLYAFMSSIPGPMSLPFIGGIYVCIGISRNNLFRKLKTFKKNYPGIIAGIWERGKPHLIVSSREVVNAVLASSENIDKIYHYRNVKIGTATMFSASGTEWRMIRNIMNPSFQTKLFPLFDDHFYNHVKTFVSNLKEHLNGDKFDIFTPIHLCTIDLICDSMVRNRIGAQENRLVRFSYVMTQLYEMLFEKIFSLLLWSDWIYALSGKKKLVRALRKEQNDYLQKMMDQRIRERAELKVAGHLETSQIYIDILLDKMDAGILSKQHIISEISEILVAGSFTTAIVLSWVFKLLAVYPDIQEKAYQEIKKNCSGEEVRLDELPELVYTEMIIKETLRHCGVPLTGRNLTKDVRVNDSMTIPAGIQLIMSAHDLHHDPEYWERPGEFYPEHFSPANEKSRPKGAFVPFMGGKRVCPGSRYAMRSMRFLVANTLLRYKFSTDENPPKDIRDIDCRYIFLLLPTNGFLVKMDIR